MTLNSAEAGSLPRPCTGHAHSGGPPPAHLDVRSTETVSEQAVDIVALPNVRACGMLRAPAAPREKILAD